MFLSIVIPCYNEAEVIEETNSRLTRLINDWLSRGVFNTYELVYVDDGSRDDTLSILKRLAAVNANIRVISFSNNFGHQAALSAGLHHARGDAVVSLDADLQDPPEVIEQMVEKYREGYDIVFGARNDRTTDSPLKRTTAQLYYRTMRMLGANLVYNHADFRLVSRKVVEEFRKFNEVNLFLRGIFPSLGFRQCVVHYSRDKRFAGVTKYRLVRLFSLAIQGLTSFSFFPLRLSAFVGGIIFLISLVMGAWSLYQKLFGHTEPGWASITIPLYLFGGLQLIFLGIIGEYIGKIYMEIKHRPLYIIKETINAGKDESNPGTDVK